MAGNRPVLIVTGPTGSGKSALALVLARAFSGTIINADSMQVYAELRVLTARPSALDERQVPHRLYGILSASERCSVGRWLAAAVREVEAAWAAGRLPIVTGGTGLYLGALTGGLSPVPPVPAALSREIEAGYDREGGAAFRERLRPPRPGLGREASGERPAAAGARDGRGPCDGQPLPAWHAGHPPRPALDARFATIVLLPQRRRLYRRLDARWHEMLANGALAEVRHLSGLGLDPGLPAMKAVGVPELARHLDGKTTLAEACAEAQAATRRYAKRQITWLRHQTAADLVIEEETPERIVAAAAAFVRGSC